MVRRNDRFTSRTPFQNPQAEYSLAPQPSGAGGAFKSLNPTSAHYHHLGPHAHGRGADRSAVTYKWSSRNNRKGRHAISVDAQAVAEHRLELPPNATGFPKIVAGLGRMLSYYPVWDVSYLVAIIFTWGSVVWCLNAFFVFLPLLRPASTFHDEQLSAGGITAFVGATIFEVGSLLLMAEAINEERSGCFGWAVEMLITDREKGAAANVVPDNAGCKHHHSNKHNFLGKGVARASTSKTAADASPAGTAQQDPSTRPDGKSWIWFPTWHDLRTHYLHELGFLACLAQLLGATIFWISGFTALPGIYNAMSPGLIDGIYWTPQVVGGCGFVVSGTLFMLETQRKWYLPAPGVLGWHIGLWNLIGGVGFTLSPCFGYSPQSWAQYQAACSTFWGSWAFLVGSVIQWYESLDKHPAKVEKLSA